MTKRAALGLAAALGLGLGLGWWLARQPPPPNPPAQAPARQPLYYRHPMNPQATSPTPAKDEMGMEYVPVYAEDMQPQAERAKPGRILYYRHPMGAADTSKMPKKDEMGMDYIPVYEGEAATARQLKISPEKIQKLGVKTAQVEARKLVRAIRALGSIQVDERRVHAVSPKFEGWIQRLHANATGMAVKRGQPLLEIYSPDLLSAQQEYLIARQGMDTLRQASPEVRATAEQLAGNALRRLRHWDIGPAQLERLQTEGVALDTLPLLSPVAGVVLDKPAVEGMRFMPGETLFRIADLSTVWLLVDVFEQDLGWIRPGQPVSAQFNAYPERVFKGRVSFIYPTFASETRTVKVRVELPNADGLLRPGLYGSAALAAADGEPPRLAVPDSAILDSGTRQLVLVRLSEGLFEPRPVKLGRKADGYVEVLDGLALGETVVTSANFLIDAESNLKAALQGMEAPVEPTRP